MQRRLPRMRESGALCACAGSYFELMSLTATRRDDALPSTPSPAEKQVLEYLTSALVTLLVTLDPPGLAPIFLGITPGMDEAERRQVAIRACIIATCIMAASGLVGAQLLGALGIGLPAFRIAGGLLLFWIAFEMVFARRNERKTEQADMAITIDHIRNVAAFPLAIPLMAGPGAITATIL